MTDPLTFASTTPRLGLPLLYAGQAQKEVTVNETVTAIDMLVHCAVEGVAAVPPSTPASGQAWLVASAATGEWSGHAGELAGWSDGGWRFHAPATGMRAFDRSSGSFRLFDGEWQDFAAPPLPSGGSTIDAEARVAIGQLVDLLKACGALR